MKKVIAVIATAFTLLAAVFTAIGGGFDRQFWLAFLPGLMGNLVILAVAVFLIDSIFKRERLDKLARTNAGQSRFVLFNANRLAYKILEYLELATMEEAHKDPELNLEFANEKLKDTDLAGVFYEKFMRAQDREAFVEGFEKILNAETEALSKGLDKIYPRPDPTIKHVLDQTAFSIGSVSFLKTLLESFKTTNAQVGPREQLQGDKLDLLIRVVYGKIGLELKKIQIAILLLSEKAKANELFMSFD